MTPEEATDLLIYNQTVRNVSVEGMIKLETDVFDHAITFDNCSINSFNATNVHFTKKVIFDKCKLNTCQFTFAYFFGGLEIINCSFKSYLDFSCGGHNISENAFKLEGSIFNDFVNFFDCFYEGPFIMRGNEFRKGTNILGNIGKPYNVTFLHNPIFENNKGELNLNEQGLI